MSLNWTEQQFADHLRQKGLAGSPPVVNTSAPPFLPPANNVGAFARGRMPDLKMNKTEAAYARHLENRLLAGDILWWRWAPMRLRLANGSYYKPDFGVLTRDCLFEIHETKGFWREAARVRIKVAAEQFPFRFIAIKKTDGGWDREEFA